MIDLERLAERIRRDIPLARHLGVEITRREGANLRLIAPLAPNVNDKGTFFAGSQSALLTLGGWILTTLIAEPVEVDVVAGSADVRFLAPAADDVEILVEAEPEAASLFRQRLGRKGRAPLIIRATLGVAGQPIATTFTGSYLASRRDEAHAAPGTS